MCCLPHSGPSVMIEIVTTETARTRERFSTETLQPFFQFTLYKIIQTSVNFILQARVTVLARSL